MTCIDERYTYRGATVRVIVYVSSSDVCREVREAASGGVSGVLGFIRRHEGCYIESESPLRVSSGDGSTTVEVHPENTMARLFWGAAVNKAKEVCRD